MERRFHYDGKVMPQLEPAALLQEFSQFSLTASLSRLLDGLSTLDDQVSNLSPSRSLCPLRLRSVWYIARQEIFPAYQNLYK